MPRGTASLVYPLLLVLAGLASAQSPCPPGKARPWPKELLAPADARGDHSAYDQRLLDYMKSGAYRNLGWCVDKAIRGTGPFYDGENLGTHTPPYGSGIRPRSSTGSKKAAPRNFPTAQ